MVISDSIVRLTAEVAVWSVLIPVLVSGVWLFRNPRGVRELKLVAGYILFAGAIEFAAMLMGRYRLNNLPLLHLYTLVQFLLVALLYKPFLIHPITPRIWLLVVVVFGIGCIYNSLFIQTIWEFNGYARAAESLIIVSFVLWYFRQLLFTDQPVAPLHDIPMFWISTGMLFYFSACFFVFLLSSDVLLLSSDVFRVSWAFHDLMLMIHYLFITIALWPTRQQKQFTSPSLQAH